MKQGVTGLQEKLLATAAITALLSVDSDTGAPRVEEGWPAELLQDPRAEAFARLHFELPTVKELAAGVEEMSGDLYAFTWYQQRDELDALEGAIRVLDQVAWEHDGARIQAFIGVSLDDPARAPDEPEHRTIGVTLLVTRE